MFSRDAHQSLRTQSERSLTVDAPPHSPAWSPDYASLDADLYLAIRNDVCSPEQRAVLQAAEHPPLSGAATPHVPGRIVAFRRRVYLHPDLAGIVGTVLGDALKHAADQWHDPALSSQAAATLNDLLEYAKTRVVQTVKVTTTRR